MRDALIAVRIHTDESVADKNWQSNNARRAHEAYTAAFSGYMDARAVEDLSERELEDALHESVLVIELAAGGIVAGSDG